MFVGNGDGFLETGRKVVYRKETPINGGSDVPLPRPRPAYLGGSRWLRGCRGVAPGLTLSPPRHGILRSDPCNAVLPALPRISMESQTSSIVNARTRNPPEAEGSKSPSCASRSKANRIGVRETFKRDTRGNSESRSPEENSPCSRSSRSSGLDRSAIGTHLVCCYAYYLPLPGGGK